MFEPISSTIGIAYLGYVGLATQTRRSSGVSHEAVELSRAVSEVVESAERSKALFGPKADAISDLHQLAIDHAEADWDGYDAEPISSEAVSRAMDFVRSFPESLPLPEFSVEPDGSVALDWTSTKTRRFSVSIASSSRLAFAWLDGADTGHGVANFNGSEFPPRIAFGISTIVGNGTAIFAA